LGLGYQDILTLPVAERRFHLGLLLKRKERSEELQETSTKNKGKGTRTTKISGAQLKSKLKSGEINPNK
jgi:hypothetical protein